MIFVSSNFNDFAWRKLGLFRNCSSLSFFSAWRKIGLGPRSEIDSHVVRLLLRQRLLILNLRMNSLRWLHVVYCQISELVDLTLRFEAKIMHTKKRAGIWCFVWLWVQTIVGLSTQTFWGSSNLIHFNNLFVVHEILYVLAWSSALFPWSSL